MVYYSKYTIKFRLFQTLAFFLIFLYNKSHLRMYETEQTQESVEQPKPTKRRRKKSKLRFVFYLAIIFAIIFIAYSSRPEKTDDESLWSYLLEASEKYMNPSNPFSQLGALTADAEKTLIGADEDRINLLLMGIGGSGHAGGSLTDTIIVASFKPSTGQGAMLSIPRDLIIPIPGYGWRKINNTYALAEYNDPGTGGDYAKQIISQIFGQQIPYYILIDFNGFEELIDLVGGIDIDVPNTLSDYEYPIRGREEYPEDQRYEHLYIEEGPQHLDGATALKYVRSRHALGEEGSDFARAARQQLVMEALTKKILSLSTLTRPSRIKKILDNVDENIDTNLSLEEFVAFGKIAKDYDREANPIHSVVLDNSIDGPLQAANYNGAFVLEPVVEDFSELKFIADAIFTPDLKYERPTDPSGLPRVTLDNPIEAKEDATIEVQNGTFVNGLARANEEKLRDLGYNVVKIGNSDNQDINQTVIYDLSNGKYPQTLDFLAANYSDNITASIPLGVSSSADILILLGLDAAY